MSTFRACAGWSGWWTGWCCKHYYEVRDNLASRRIWLSVHSAAFARPFDFNPFRPTGHRDDMCLLGYRVARKIVSDAFGVEPLTVSTEGGVYTPFHLGQLWPECVAGGKVVHYEGSSEVFYTSETWGARVREAFDFLDAQKDLEGMCMWHLWDIGNEWDGGGWYASGWTPRSPVLALREP